MVDYTNFIKEVLPNSNKTHKTIHEILNKQSSSLHLMNPYRYADITLEPRKLEYMVKDAMKHTKRIY